MSSIEPNNSQPFNETFPQKQSTTPTNQATKRKVNDLIEKIFLITIDESKSQDQPKVVLEEIASSLDSTEEKLINLELLEQALFERLLLPSPLDYLRPKSSSSDEAAETKVITYLFRSFAVCEKCKHTKDTLVQETCESIENLIFRNASTSMKQPELYEGQSLHSQWLDIIKDFDNDTEMVRKFLVNTTKEMYSDDKLTSMGSLKAIFYPMFNEIHRKIRTATFTDLDRWVMPLLRLFVSEKTCPELAELVIDFSTPNPDAQGREYSETFLGLLIGLSILPKFQEDPYIYYTSPTEANNDSYTNSLWTYLESHQIALHGIFKSLLTIGPIVKTKTLAWIGNCLHSNAKRAQLQSVQMLGNLTCASDAFLLGLCSVLLYLSAPLCRPGFKVLLVDPTYAAVPVEETGKNNIAMKELAKETCLLPVEEGEEQRVSLETYNFITELFFMTHKAIQLSYEVCQSKFVQSQNMVYRLQNEFELARNQRDSEAANYLHQNYLMAATQFFCLRNTLIEPKNGENLLKFFECSALWLTQITVKTEEDMSKMAEAKSFAPKEKKDVRLPIPDYVPPYLRSIPEFLFTNIVTFMEHRRLYEDGGIRLSVEAQNEIFRWILIFMGSIKRTKSPHLRAQLAVAFRCLLPDPTVSSFQIHVFDNHPDRYEIVHNLLHVFVAIEMTGQSVEFELKFGYRRPMYAVMKFLWEREDQKNCFKLLAQEALQNIEAVDPPIFLRFINLLINDAIYLLDDSLSHIKQIREMETTQDSDAWTTMSQTDQQTLQRSLTHLTRQTAIYNTLSKETISMLVLITTEIKDIFCHASMVERIGAMLNYFLLNLVGPKKKDFKVKDKTTLEFDPASMVKEICRIYVNLVGSHEFCLAVSQEGRSYSSDLFKYAEEVLARVGGGQLITDIREFAIKVERIDKQHKEDQEALIDPPDEFMDPIMSTLMTDPVILPSSKVTVDRTTIARHLLSDQTDPFNRSPLTMDQVQSNIDLKTEIESWIDQKRIEYSERKAI